jgi:hypothetical protein
VAAKVPESLVASEASEARVVEAVSNATRNGLRRRLVLEWKERGV